MVKKTKKSSTLMVESSTLTKDNTKTNQQFNTVNNTAQNHSVNSEKLHQLKCLYTNAQSIVRKMPDLQIYVENVKPEIIAITESWTHEQIPNSEIAIDGYTLFRKDRKHNTKTRGGGCLLYIKDIINASLNEEIDNIGTESIWCNIVTGHQTLLLGVCYRSPNNNDEENLNLYNVIKTASQKHAIILGDFNQPNINWNTMETNNLGQDFMNVIQDSFLIQHICEPTHKHGNILDLVLTTETNMIENIYIGEPLASSDHFSIICDVVVSVDINNNKRQVLDYSKGNYDEMRKYIANIDWNHTLDGKNTEEMWLSFKETIHVAVEKYVPVRKGTIKKKQQWMTRPLLRLVKKKYHLWKKYTQTKSYQDYSIYKKELNKTTNEIKRAKKLFETKLAENIKRDSKSFYAYSRSKLKTKDKVGPLTNDEGIPVTDDKETAEMLNNFFTSVFTDESLQDVPIPENVFNLPAEDSLHELQVTPETIHEKLINLKPNKAPGDDRIYPRVLMELADNISLPLATIYNSSLKTSYVPMDWRRANVAALHKKGSRSSSSNYRPVSLTSHVCKVLESILRDYIVDHLDKHNLIGDSQHGFRKGRSCLTNLLLFMDDITQYVDKGYPVDIIYLDFAKAFDKVPHYRLIQKLKAHGINGQVKSWIESWLRDREQRVHINGKYSEWKKVSSGVPQGSVLGPILFTLFINDIDNNVKSKILKFADDTKLYRMIRNEEDSKTLQCDIDRLYNWSLEWQMEFNVDKCKVMHIGRNNTRHNYSMNGKFLLTTEYEKDLGVIIENNLSHGRNVASAANKANRTLGIISRIFTCKNKEILMPLYKSLVRPQLEYCVQAWNPYLRKDINILERVQRRFTRMIPSIRHLPYNERLKRLNLTTLEMRRFRGDLIETFKIMHGKENINKDVLFHMNESTRTRGHNYKIYKCQAKLMMRKFSFSYRIVNAWNSLPAEAVNAKHINEFKSFLTRRNLAQLMGDYTSQ